MRDCSTFSINLLKVCISNSHNELLHFHIYYGSLARIQFPYWVTFMFPPEFHLILLLKNILGLFTEFYKFSDLFSSLDEDDAEANKTIEELLSPKCQLWLLSSKHLWLLDIECHELQDFKNKMLDVGSMEIAIIHKIFEVHDGQVVTRDEVISAF